MVALIVSAVARGFCDPFLVASLFSVQLLVVSEILFDCFFDGEYKTG